MEGGIPKSPRPVDGAHRKVSEENRVVSRGTIGDLPGCFGI